VSGCAGCSAAAGQSAAEFFGLAIYRDMYRIRLAEFMERYPIITCAPFCVTAFEHGALEVDIDRENLPLEARLTRLDRILGR
jgi:hypothetical protein